MSPFDNHLIKNKEIMENTRKPVGSHYVIPTFFRYIRDLSTERRYTWVGLLEDYGRVSFDDSYLALEEGLRFFFLYLDSSGIIAGIGQSSIK
jgi:hypothetical protein